MSAPQPRKVLRLPKVRMLSRSVRLATPSLPSGIRITNVKSIRPPTPNPEIVKKQEEEKLRAQVQQEIASRAQTCPYSGYECWAPVPAGRRYCAAHALQDPTAPFVQCSHAGGAAQGSHGGAGAGAERCAAPAPALPPGARGQPLCFEHARAALLARQRSAAPPPPVISTETLLTQLQHYVKTERPRTTSCASSVSVVSDPAEPEQQSPGAVDPFKQMDATAINSAYSSSILECASGSSSDAESVTLGPDGTCRLPGGECDTDEETPAETAPLWRAGVFTAEEAVSETKSVLRSLQAAYIRQMDRLKVLLQTSRLQYLRALKNEKEQYCSINSQARNGPLSVRERRQLRKLKAYAGYHRKHGVDAVLARKLHHKRAKCNETSQARIPSAIRCTFTEGGVRCPTQVVPAAKHCAKHILLDHQQVLFHPCGDLRGVESCKEPVPYLPLPSHSCRYHTDPPTYSIFTLKKDDSESETDSDTPTDSMTEELEQPIESNTLNQTFETLDPPSVGDDGSYT